jgi:two-component system, NarL family, response regulator NreC
MGKIKILIADDHAIVRDGLKALLGSQPDIEVVAEAVNGDEAVEKTREFLPEVILMDITMPGKNGLDATREIKKAFPEVKILVLTMHESDEYFFKMLDAGASGYFIKGGSTGELINAVHTVSQGDVFLHPSVAKKLLSDYLRREKVGPERQTYDGLTGRELEIIKLVAGGYTNQEIANSLVVSAATVQTHRAHIMAKLGLHSRTELVRYALKKGYVTLENDQV